MSAYVLSPAKSTHLEQLTRLHQDAYPHALLTKLKIVRDYFANLFDNPDDIVAFIAHTSTSKEVVGYCIGTLDGGRITNYTLWTHCWSTMLKICIRAMITPSLWTVCLLQLWGWLRGFRVYPAKDENKAALLVDMACAKTHRRQGLGRQLVEEWQREMVRRGATHVRLYVRKDNETAISFYEKLGWKTDCPMDNIQCDGFVMIKAIQ